MKRLLSFICKFVGAVTLLALFTSAVLLVSAGYWLPQQGEPGPADYLVVLAGSPSRAMCAADLYNEGLAPRVLISKPFRDHVIRQVDALGAQYVHSEELNLEILLLKGVPRAAIDLFGEDNMSTAQEAMELQKRYADSGASFLIVTSPYHVRRTRMIFDNLLPCCAHQVVGSPYEPFTKQWWKERQSARALVLETAKFLFYLGGGRFISSGHPPADPQSTPHGSAEKP